MSGYVKKDAAISEIMQSLRRVFKAIHDYSRDVSDYFGVTGPQLWAMKALAEERGLSLGELARKMCLHPSTITGVVDRLEGKGHVCRERDMEDRRVVKVRLTPAGETLVKKAPNPAQGKMIHGLRKVKAEDLRVINESVRKLVEIMEVQDVKVTFFFDQEEER